MDIDSVTRIMILLSHDVQAPADSLPTSPGRYYHDIDLLTFFPPHPQAHHRALPVHLLQALQRDPPL